MYVCIYIYHRPKIEKKNIYHRPKIENPIISRTSLPKVGQVTKMEED